MPCEQGVGTSWLPEWPRKNKAKWQSGEAGGRGEQGVVLMGGTPMLLTGRMPVLRNTLRCLPACAGMTLLRTGLLRQTNPISERAIWRTSAVPTRSWTNCMREEPRENKANFPKRGTEAVSRLRVAECGQTYAGTPALRLATSGLRGPVVQTNPILRLRVGDEPVAGRLPVACPLPRGGQMRKTNPIGRTESCETKPISEEVSSVKRQVLRQASGISGPRSLPTSNFTLQTSSGTPTAQSELCKTKPIRPGRIESPSA